MSSSSSLAQCFSSTCILKPYIVVRNNDTDTTTTTNNNNNPIPSSNSNNHHNNIITINNKGKYTTSSIYYDSYGGSTIHLPLLLQFTSQDNMNQFLQQQCIQPIPMNYNTTTNTTSNNNNITNNNDSNTTTTTTTSSNKDHHHHTIQQQQQHGMIAIEAKVTLTYGTGYAISSKVERVTIVSTYILPNENTDSNNTNDNQNDNQNETTTTITTTTSLYSSILFNTEIVVRVSNVHNNNHHNNYSNNDNNNNYYATNIFNPIDASKVQIQLEVLASYNEYNNNNNNNNNTVSSIGLQSQLLLSSSLPTNETNVAVSSLLYESAMNILSSSSTTTTTTSVQQQLPPSQNNSTNTTTAISSSSSLLLPISIHVSLYHAIQVTVRSVPSGSTNIGQQQQQQTYIAITIHHTNIHPYPIHITNITLHPSVGTTTTKNRLNNSTVQWGFVSSKGNLSSSSSSSSSLLNNNNEKNDIQLLSIQPNESQSIILYVNATMSINTNHPSYGYGMDPESFYNCSCPLTITAILTNKEYDNKMINNNLQHFTVLPPLSSSSSTLQQQPQQQQLSDTTTTIITVTSNVRYTASYTTAATESSSNSFRIYMTIVSNSSNNSTSSSSSSSSSTVNDDVSSSSMGSVLLGKPMIVQLDIYNIGSETQNQLTLVMDSSSSTSSNNIKNTNDNQSSGSWTIISHRQDQNKEQQGYTFRMIGPERNNVNNNIRNTETELQQQEQLYDNDDPVVNHYRDLILIDTSVSIGDISVSSGPTTYKTSSSSTTSKRVQLRMIPLRTGTISIPNFTLINQKNGKKYYCIHQLKAVVVASAVVVKEGS